MLRITMTVQVESSRSTMSQSVEEYNKNMTALGEELRFTQDQYKQACQEMVSLREELTNSTQVLEEKEQLLLTEVRDALF